MKISVVIPCYKVENHIEQVIQGLPSEITYIIVVNDCSTDNTENVIMRLKQENEKIIYIKHDINQGVGGSMLSGFRKSIELDCDIVVKMDGDNQMDAAYIHKLIKPIKEGKADFSKGNRFKEYKDLRKMPLIRRIGNLGLSFCIKAASGYWNIFDPTNGFVAISNETLKSLDFDKIHKRYFFESSLLIELYHVNAVIQEIPMKARYGDETSHLSITRTLFEFPPKLFKAFIKRILIKYFFYEFNIASVYILFGLPIFLFGSIYGGINFIKYASSGVSAPTGTVVIPTLLITLGFQLLLSAINFDINNYPKK